MTSSGPPKSPHTPKPVFFAKWESPDVRGAMQALKEKQEAPRTLRGALITLLLAVLSFFVVNITSLRKLFLMALNVNWISEREDKVIVAGTVLSVLLAILAIIGLVRWILATQSTTIAMLTEKQRELIGAPKFQTPDSTKETTTPQRTPTRTSTPTRINAPSSPFTISTPPVPSPASAQTFRSPSSPYSSGFGSPYSFASPSASASPIVSSPGLRQRVQYSPVSSPTIEGEIRNAKSLDDYLKQYEEQQRTKSQAEAVATPDPYAPAPPLQKYRPSYRPPPRSSPRGITSEEFGHLNAFAAQERLDKLGISSYIDEWTERIRLWLVYYILKPVVAKMDLVEKAGLTLNAPLTEKPPPSMTPLFHSTPTVLFPPDQANPDELLRERWKLEKYMKVMGGSAREYLSHRIRELAKGEAMAAYKWNGGAPWKDKEWTSELPTDAQILIHLFCTFMDHQLPDIQGRNEKPFSSRHIIVFPETPDMTVNIIRIYERHRNPPHFEVASTETWPVIQGRNNLFQALVLFVYCVWSKQSGYLGQISLGSKQIGLLAVIDKK